VVADRPRPELRSGLGLVESAIYLTVAALLALCAVMVVAVTVADLVEGSDSRAISDAGVFLLDRVLLLFIIAELLYTLRVVNLDGRIQAEPFLFIGLIAIVRKVLVVTAEVARRGQDMTGFLLQISALAALALVLSLSIHLLRRTGVQPTTTAGRARPSDPAR
jgi:uncharacterized membrane protein (DUF373 family)